MRLAATGVEHDGRAARLTHRRLAGLAARDETAARSHDTPVRSAKPEVLRVGNGRKHKRNDENHINSVLRVDKHDINANRSKKRRQKM